jgi:hypothetical protein
MYLMDTSAPPVNNRKWNLGRMRGLGCDSCPSRGMGCASCPGGGTASSSPLDYTSPQAAIIAGLDPNTVVAAWTKALARFPSPQAAISAGVPAGVVNQLWQQSNVNAANAAARRGGLGRLGGGRLGRMGLSPVRLPNLGASSSTAQAWRMGRLRGLGRLGDAGSCVYYGADGVTVESIDANTDVVECAGNGGAWNAAPILNMPSPVGRQNPSPIAGSASNAGITTVTMRPPSTVPTQAAAPASFAVSSAQLTSLLPWAAGGLLLFAVMSGGGKGRH